MLTSASIGLWVCENAHGEMARVHESLQRRLLAVICEDSAPEPVKPEDLANSGRAAGRAARGHRRGRGTSGGHLGRRFDGRLGRRRGGFGGVSYFRGFGTCFSRRLGLGASPGCLDGLLRCGNGGCRRLALAQLDGHGAVVGCCGRDLTWSGSGRKSSSSYPGRLHGRGMRCDAIGWEKMSGAKSGARS